MKWVKVIIDEENNQIYGRIDDDGVMRVTCVEAHPELQEWIEQGGVVEPADTPEEAE